MRRHVMGHGGVGKTVGHLGRVWWMLASRWVGISRRLLRAVMNRASMESKPPPRSTGYNHARQAGRRERERREWACLSWEGWARERDNGRHSARTLEDSTATGGMIPVAQRVPQAERARESCPKVNDWGLCCDLCGCGWLHCGVLGRRSRVRGVRVRVRVPNAYSPLWL